MSLVLTETWICDECDEVCFEVYGYDFRVTKYRFNCYCYPRMVFDNSLVGDYGVFLVLNEKLV